MHPIARSHFSLCLAVDDVAAARRFYEALGFEVTVEEDQWVQMGNGALELSLMSFLEENLINLRGGDVRAAHEALAAAGLAGDTEPEAYTAEEMGSDGWHWTVTDPAGNAVYFDTTDPEAELSSQVEVMVRQFERRLANLGIESGHADAFVAEMTERFGLSAG